jgi:hypothetical protein
MILPLAMMALGADSATGKWVLEPAARQTGTSQPTIRPDVLDLKADGATLTGSVTAGLCMSLEPTRLIV